MSQDDTKEIEVDPDDVPMYDDDDPDGDRRPYIDAPEHVNNPDLFPDEDPDG